MGRRMSPGGQGHNTWLLPTAYDRWPTDFLMAGRAWHVLSALTGEASMLQGAARVAFRLCYMSDIRP
jgi:hypothetical protein